MTQSCWVKLMTSISTETDMMPNRSAGFEDQKEGSKGGMGISTWVSVGTSTFHHEKGQLIQQQPEYRT